MPIRVLYVAHVPTISGAELSLLTLINNLDRARVQPLLICPATGPLLDRARELGIETAIVHMPYPMRTANPLRLTQLFLAWLMATIQLYWLIRSRGINLVHANLFVSLLYVLVPARLNHVPIIWHHRSILKRYRTTQFVVRICGRMVTAIIAISQAVRQSLLETGIPPQKIVVIYNPVELRDFDRQFVDPVLRSELGLTDDIKLIGIVGRLTAWKGHEDFFEAAKQVVAQMDHVRFVVVGDVQRPDNVFSEALAAEVAYKWHIQQLPERLGISRYVIFLGWRLDIHSVMRSLDILVNASWSEPFGRTIIEAMAMGVPVVATNVGGPSEIIENGVTGLLVPPRNPSALAQALLWLLHNNQQVQPLVAAAQQQAREMFDAIAITEQVMRLYIHCRRLAKEERG